MKKMDEDWRLRSVEQAQDETPEVFAVVRGEKGYQVSRRALLTGLGAGALAGRGRAQEDVETNGAGESSGIAVRSRLIPVTPNPWRSARTAPSSPPAAIPSSSGRSPKGGS